MLAAHIKFEYVLSEIGALNKSIERRHSKVEYKTIFIFLAGVI